MEESLKSHPNQSTIQPQKPSSFSNILDAVDSSTLGHLFSDIQYSDPTGFEPTPPAKYGSLGQSNDILPKLPYWKSVPSMENQLKRQRSSMDGDVPCPSKKLTSSCTFTTNPNQSDLPQSYFNQSLFNQALLLNPYFPFQGWKRGFRQGKEESKKKKKKEEQRTHPPPLIKMCTDRAREGICARLSCMENCGKLDRISNT